MANPEPCNSAMLDQPLMVYAPKDHGQLSTEILQCLAYHSFAKHPWTMVDLNNIICNIWLTVHLSRTPWPWLTCMIRILQCLANCHILKYHNTKVNFQATILQRKTIQQLPRTTGSWRHAAIFAKTIIYLDQSTSGYTPFNVYPSWVDAQCKEMPLLLRTVVTWLVDQHALVWTETKLKLQYIFSTS